MKDIKTRDKVKGTIKTIDKSTAAIDKMKRNYLQTKEKAEKSTQTDENSAEEYAFDKVETETKGAAIRVARRFDKQGRKSLNITKEKIRQFKEKSAEEPLKNSIIHRTDEKSVKTLTKSIKPVKKPSNKTVKTAEYTAKLPIKVTRQSTKNAQKTMQTSVNTAQRAANATKATVKSAVKATVSAVKAIIAGTKALITAIIAGGWIAVIAIIIICLIALILGSVFGIFFSGEVSQTGMSMQTAVQEIDKEYCDKISEITSSTQYNVLEMKGSKAIWKDVLAVYAVKINTDPNNPQEVATMDDNKKQLLKDIFWKMNSINSNTETKKNTVISETDDGNGNIVQTKNTVTQTCLYITVTHKSANEMADNYGFNEEQRDYLSELLDDKNNQLWASVLYGINASNDDIVNVALAQIGNVGGQPYWSWYGFENRIEWCACFVSWCANECGYIEKGVIPKFSLCSDGESWFKAREQWIDNSYEPLPGTIIFFDWDLNGVPNHVGIVQKCENGVVYTVEGNSGDSCKTKQYAVGSEVIYGYGLPAY